MSLNVANVDFGGVARAGQTVHVYDHGTTNHSTIYAADGVTPLGNPLTVRGNGHVVFVVADGTYDLVGADLTRTVVVGSPASVSVSSLSTRSAIVDQTSGFPGPIKTLFDGVLPEPTVPTFIGVTQGWWNDPSIQPVAPTLPAGWQPGDLAIIFFAADRTIMPVYMPGWKLLAKGFLVQTLARVLQAGDTLPAPVLVSASAAPATYAQADTVSKGAWTVVVYRGVDQAIPCTMGNNTSSTVTSALVSVSLDTSDVLQVVNIATTEAGQGITSASPGSNLRANLLSAYGNINSFLYDRVATLSAPPWQIALGPAATPRYIYGQVGLYSPLPVLATVPAGKVWVLKEIVGEQRQVLPNCVLGWNGVPYQNAVLNSRVSLPGVVLSAGDTLCGRSRVGFSDYPIRVLGCEVDAT